MNVAVACGVAVGTAVLTGALLVGDSMRGSLRDLALAGLGNIDEALVADHFFREQLADGSSGTIPPAAGYSLNWQGWKRPIRDSPEHVDQVNVIGCDERFWHLFSGGHAAVARTSDEIVLNEPLAQVLAVEAGDAVLLSPGEAGRDSGGKRAWAASGHRWIPCGSAS